MGIKRWKKELMEERIEMEKNAAPGDGYKYPGTSCNYSLRPAMVGLQVLPVPTEG